MYAREKNGENQLSHLFSGDIEPSEEAPLSLWMVCRWSGLSSLSRAIMFHSCRRFLALRTFFTSLCNVPSTQRLCSWKRERKRGFTLFCSDKNLINTGNFQGLLVVRCVLCMKLKYYKLTLICIWLLTLIIFKIQILVHKIVPFASSFLFSYPLCPAASFLSTDRRSRRDRCRT